jgi:hypothetical protein
MKLKLLLVLGMFVLSQQNTNAQKTRTTTNKTKKTAAKKSTNVDRPIMVEDVPMELDTVIEGKVDGYKIADYNPRKTMEKVPFGADNKFYKIIKDDPNRSYEYVYGIEDAAGKTILPTVFNSIEILNENEAVKVGLGGTFALYSMDFKNILPPQYSNLFKVKGKDVYEVVIIGDYYRTKLVDIKGKNILDKPDYELTYNNSYNSTNTRDGLYKIYNPDNFKYSLYQATTNTYYFKDQINSIDFTDYDFILVNGINNNDKLTVLDVNTLKPIFTKTFDEVRPITNKLLKVKYNGKYGLLDRNGSEVMPAIYDNMETIYSDIDLLLCKKDNKYGIAELDGKFLFPLGYDVLQSIGRGMFLHANNKKYGIKNLLGSSVLQPKYDNITGIGDGNYLCTEGQNGFVYNTYTKDFKPVGFIKTEKLNYYHYAALNKEGKKAILDAEGKVQGEFAYEDLQYVSSNNKDYFIGKISANQFVLLNQNGVKIGTKVFESIQGLSNYSLFLVKQNGKYGVMEPSGILQIAIENDWLGFDSYEYNSDKIVGIVNGQTKSYQLNASYKY